MNVGRYSTLCALRRQFNTIQDLADVINRSRPYVVKRLKGAGDFTAREKRMILAAIGKENTEENIVYFFGGLTDAENGKQKINKFVANAV